MASFGVVGITAGFQGISVAHKFFSLCRHANMIPMGGCIQETHPLIVTAQLNTFLERASNFRKQNVGRAD